MDYRAWLRLQPRVIARIWWCGDDYCDCTKPLIERITPNREAGYPWIRREALWSGKFITDTWQYDRAEREELQYEPLREECRRIGIPVPRELIRHLAGPVGSLP